MPHILQRMVGTRRRIALGAGVLLAAGVAGIAASRAARPAPPQGELYLAQRTKGSESAVLTIYELSDFQCPFCRRQALETLPLLEKEYIATGKVRWIFLNYPLSQIHPNAIAAAELAMCAARVDKFWPIHDLLFTYQGKWAPLKDPGPFLITLADSAGIPRDDLVPCLDQHQTLELVKQEADGAAGSGVSSTPTVYVAGVGLLSGAAPIEVYRKVLDSLITAKGQ